MDPKLKEAYLKMKKLDRILAKKIKKEKSVKRDRMLLQKRYVNKVILLNVILKVFFFKFLC